MEDMDIRPELRHDGTSARLPASAINLTTKEKQELCEFFRSVKGPSGYSSNMNKLVLVKEQKFLPMKAAMLSSPLCLLLQLGTYCQKKYKWPS